MPSCRPGLTLALALAYLGMLGGSANALSARSSSSASSKSKTIYGIPNSGWTSPQWNWGSAIGTGHDCAAICRQNYSTRERRSELIQNLYVSDDDEERIPQNFEEVKLTLALAWQKGRWSGSDGGRGGYGQVLVAMADAERYETEGTEEDCSWRLVQDMQQRFPLLQPPKDMLDEMDRLPDEYSDDYDAARRKCSALVLLAMGFVENGC